MFDRAASPSSVSDFGEILCKTLTTVPPKTFAVNFASLSVRQV